MKILVTGGDGLLGRELCKSLEHHEVYSVVHKPVIAPLHNVTYVLLDLSKRLKVTSLPPSIDTVVHLAQSSEFRSFPSGVRDTFDVNTSSTLDLLDYCRSAGGKKFILASTGGIYESQGEPITESSKLIPSLQLGFYFASKLAAEMLASTFRPFFDVTILRFFFMYGLRQRPDMLLPRLIHRVLNEQSIQVDTRGGMWVNPIYVRDAAHLVSELVGRKSPAVLNVAGKDIVSIRQISTTIGDLVGKTVKFEEVTRSYDIVADISQMLEFIPTERITPFNLGLEDVVRSVVASQAS